LPTSLKYIRLITIGCSPWGPDADMGTEREECRTLDRLFLSDRVLPNTPKIGVHLAWLFPYHGLKPFHGAAPR